MPHCLQYASPDIEIILVGNKCHLKHRKVPRELGENISKQHNIAFIETSDETGMNIDEAFEKLARLMLKNVRHNHGHAR